MSEAAAIFIADPLIELLAIKLYEHSAGRVPTTLQGWQFIPEATREMFRSVASGNSPLEFQKISEDT